MGEAIVATGQLWHFLNHLFSTAGDRAQSDAELLDRFARMREEHAFGGLVQRHGPMVLAVCRRLLHQTEDAEDAFQATFLVLAKKAGAIRKQESVGSWLYGTAYRMALKVRESRGRRGSHERPPEESPPLTEYPAVPSSHLSDLDHGELRAVLDEEMQRLPEKYRAPLVLCYLEGKTNEQAARELSWTKGTVSGRLARARDLLRERLAKRGLALTSLALTAALSEQLSAAAVPVALAGSTIESSLLFAAGETVPAHLAILAEGALRAMTMTKLKMVAALVLAAGVLGFGAGLIGYQFKGTGVAVAVPLDDKKPVEAKGKTDPHGVPLELKLTAKKDTYTLDLGGKTAEEFRKTVEASAKKLGARDLPVPPTVDLTLELRNTGDKEIKFLVGGRNVPSVPTLTLGLKGPGAVQFPVFGPRAAIPEARIPPQEVTLAPGKTHILQQTTSLSLGFPPGINRNGQVAYWTQPGEYVVTFTYQTAVSPAPLVAKAKGGLDPTKPPVLVLTAPKGFGMVTLTSNSIRLKVVGAK